MDERDAAGNPIHRHETASDPTWSGGDPELVAAMTGHVERWIGPVDRVWHQEVSPWVHVDVHVVAPTPHRDAVTLVTTGMSERPMTPPEGLEDLRCAELVMVLPPDWPLDRPEGLWPLTLLQTLAQLPHQFDTWLWAGHTVPNDDPPEPYGPGTALCGVILAEPVLAPEEFALCRVGDRDVHLLSVVPLHADEMQFKLDRGPDALFDRLGRAGVTEGLVPDRPSVAGGRRRRGLLRRR
jgi:hypothetical protein